MYALWCAHVGFPLLSVRRDDLFSVDSKHPLSPLYGHALLKPETEAFAFFIACGLFVRSIRLFGGSCSSLRTTSWQTFSMGVWIL
jgi:hypothetical protein